MSAGSDRSEPARRLEVAAAAARAGAAVAAEHFLTVGIHAAEGKEAEEGWNPVSKVDRLAEDAIVATIRRHYPDDQFLGEENTAGQERVAEHLWILDPIDGTSNYLHGVPHYGVSVAYALSGETVAAFCIDPSRGEEFAAVAGGGAQLCTAEGTWQDLHVSPAAHLSEAMICTGFYYDRGDVMRRTLDSIERLFGEGIHGIRRTGSAVLDLCWVAAGRFDAFYEYTLSTWDFAAAALIASEAGARVTSVEGDTIRLDDSSIIAAAPAIHAALARTVRAAGS